MAQHILQAQPHWPSFNSPDTAGLFLAQSVGFCHPLYLKRCDAGKDRRQEEEEQQRLRRLDGIIISMVTSLSKLREIAKNREAWHGAVHGAAESDTTD